MIKIGDKLYCHDNDYGISSVTVGKIYSIVDSSYSERIIIKDDNGRQISFTIYQDVNGLSYKNWFIGIIEYRKNKLLEIEHNI